MASSGRRYGLVDYHGAPDADRVIVVMGSASGAVALRIASTRIFPFASTSMQTGYSPHEYGEAWYWIQRNERI